MSYKSFLASALATGVAASFLTAPSFGQNLTTELVASGFARPLFMTQPENDNDRFFVCEGHTGRIEIVDRTNSNAIIATPFLDIVVATGNEQGLTGMAFHPEYMTPGHAKEGRFYICYNASGSGQTRVVEYEATGGDPTANTANPTAIDTIITVNQPASNHNGGMIAFGSDGKLYLSLGDGGGANDGFGNGQNNGTLLGSILRLDVDIPNPYVPADNPFVGVPGADEIWMWGQRNPWRFSFDSVNGDIYIGDVGQGAREEVSWAAGGGVGGENFGWNCREGDIAFSGGNCTQPPFVDPVHDFVSSGHCSVIGGYVYHGAIPGLDGTYFFADYCSASLWSSEIDPINNELINVVDREFELNPVGPNSITSITSFAQDNDGEVYVIEQGGQIWKIVEDCTAQAINYCTLSPNSFSSGSQISSIGSLLLSDNSLSLTVAGAIPNEFGLFIFGQDQASVLNGDGTLCVGGPLYRVLPAIVCDFLGSAVMPLDVNTPAPLAAPFLPGTTYNFQFWHRDNNGPGGSGYNWSDGLEITFCP